MRALAIRAQIGETQASMKPEPTPELTDFSRQGQPRQTSTWSCRAALTPASVFANLISYVQIHHQGEDIEMGKQKCRGKRSQDTIDKCEMHDEEQQSND